MITRQRARAMEASRLSTCSTETNLTVPLVESPEIGRHPDGIPSVAGPSGSIPLVQASGRSNQFSLDDDSLFNQLRVDSLLEENQNLRKELTEKNASMTQMSGQINFLAEELAKVQELVTQNSMRCNNVGVSQNINNVAPVVPQASVLGLNSREV